MSFGLHFATKTGMTRASFKSSGFGPGLLAFLIFQIRLVCIDLEINFRSIQLIKHKH